MIVTLTSYYRYKFLLLLILLTAHSSQADITTVEPLSFGTIVVQGNSSVSEISIDTKNKLTKTNYIRILNLGQRGEYFLSDFPAFTQLFTSANITSSETASSVGSSQQFTLSALTTAPSVTTDGDGTATIFVGGTLQTSGSGIGQYFDTGYTVSFELTVDF
jgi:hypothetical protein